MHTVHTIYTVHTVHTVHIVHTAHTVHTLAQFFEGEYALSNGYLLSATILSAMLVHIIDGKFDRSAAWLLLAAAFAATGIIHSPTLGVYDADHRFSAMYLLAALALAIIHAVQNRGEQLAELQASKWSYHTN